MCFSNFGKFIILPHCIRNFFVILYKNFECPLDLFSKRFFRQEATCVLIGFIVLLVVFLLLSVLSFMGKLTTFITGEKTKDNTEHIYNERSAGNFIGIIMSLLVVSTALGILGFLVADAKWLILAAPIGFILLLIFALIFINTNNRFVEGSEINREEDNP